MIGFDGMKVGDLTGAEIEGRRRMKALLDFAREQMPGFANAYFVDFAPQTGVRQTRLLEGEYVVTKRDVTDRVHFHDSILAAAATTTRLTARYSPRVWSSCWSRAATIPRHPRRRRSAGRFRPAWRWARAAGHCCRAGAGRRDHRAGGRCGGQSRDRCAPRVPIRGTVRLPTPWCRRSRDDGAGRARRRAAPSPGGRAGARLQPGDDGSLLPPRCWAITEPMSSRSNARTWAICLAGTSATIRTAATIRCSPA